MNHKSSVGSWEAVLRDPTEEEMESVFKVVSAFARGYPRGPSSFKGSGWKCDFIDTGNGRNDEYSFALIFSPGPDGGRSVVGTFTTSGIICGVTAEDYYHRSATTQSASTSISTDHRSVEYLLRLALPRERQDEVIGDLLEEFNEAILPNFRPLLADIWLLRHSLALIGTALHLRRWALIAAATEFLKRHIG